MVKRDIVKLCLAIEQNMILAKARTQLEPSLSNLISEHLALGHRVCSTIDRNDRTLVRWTRLQLNISYGFLCGCYLSDLDSARKEYVWSICDMWKTVSSAESWGRKRWYQKNNFFVSLLSHLILKFWSALYPSFSKNERRQSWWMLA